MHVPLIVAAPGVAARVVPDQVRIADVMPTILDLRARRAADRRAGREPSSGGARRAHLDLLALSESWYPRYHYGWSELTAVRDGRYMFIAAPRRELCDTQTDPGEQRDLVGREPARLADALDRGAAADDGEDRGARSRRRRRASIPTSRSGCARSATSARASARASLEDAPARRPRRTRSRSTTC